ncbi:cation transporter, partial [Pseudorhodobacter sp.]|uniref:heavy metal translocating P-type ATPase n=1 Tax=Pseudorhodobacter sp. TaxID=1934400 RepID=UPI00264A3E6A
MATTYRLFPTNMSCASCVGRVERAIASVASVTDSSVNLATETASFTATVEALPQVAAKLADAGYPARQASTRLNVSGMSCASCVGRVEKHLKAQPGVIDATVNLATRTADITYLDGAVTPQTLAATVTAAGYESSAPSAEGDATDSKADEESDLPRAMVLAAALTLPVFLIEMGGHVIPGLHHWINATIGQQTSWMIQFILITLVMVGPGRRFYAHGIPALLRGAPEMNSLVAIGTATAWVYSTLALFAPGLFPAGTHAVYYEAAGVIITLILLGRWLEARAKGRTGA